MLDTAYNMHHPCAALKPVAIDLLLIQQAISQHMCVTRE